MLLSAKSSKIVSFQATRQDTAKSARYKPLVYRSVKENEGGGYDPATGVFTCPTAGTYVFSATVGRERGDGYATASITVDESPHSWFCGSSTCTGSSSVSLQLKEGQKVWVEACSGGDYSSADGCFTGALVQPQL